MMVAPWQALATKLAEGPQVSFWLRDDDAVAVTPALARLDTIRAASGAPLLLAVIPAFAEPALGVWAAARDHVAVCQHGYAHRNHAPPGERACELGGARDDAAVLDDLARGQAAMEAIFGRDWAPILVPPWNRIRGSLADALPGAGFVALSTFAGSALPPGRPARLDCDLDIIDWRHGRRGRDHGELCRRLVDLVDGARQSGRPIGILTHHLAHDETCWTFLEHLLPLLQEHPAARLIAAGEVLASQGAPRLWPPRHRP